MTPAEKVAYIKGLMDGMELDTDKGEGKILAAMLDVLEDLAYGQEEIEEAIGELSDGLDVVSDDLEDVEELLFSDEDEDDACCCCDEDDCCCGDGDCDCDEDECDCGHHHHHHHHDDEDEEFEYEVECPACGETLILDEDDLEAGVIECPECGETLELELTID